MENNDCLEREVQSGACKVVESVATKWTNEKHKSYLNHMEASFIEQLHNNELFDWLWRTPVHAASHGLVPKSQSIDQVLRRGCRESSGFAKDDKLNKNGSDRERNGGNADNFKKAEQFCFHRLQRDSIEVSDQNFVDDNVVDEWLSKGRGKKRSRSTVSSITDQVVPFISPMPTEKMEEFYEKEV